jgi:phosphoribosylaminoimidazole-succinocarboxamide synthase
MILSSHMSDRLYEGKSKIICAGPDEGSFVLRYKDTATAFNGEKKEELSGKGALNAAISRLIFGYLEKNGVQTHLIKVIDDTTWLVKKAEIIMVEVIVRNVAAGGFSKKYGVPEGTALKNIVAEFSLKSDALGDPMINDRQITAIGIATAAELDEMTAQALKINDLLSALLLKTGIRLVDFKLEFGRCGGKIILCDEISPDSCRFWDAETNKKLDKDRFRRDMGDVLDGYRDVLARLQKVIA